MRGKHKQHCASSKPKPRALSLWSHLQSPPQKMKMQLCVSTACAHVTPENLLRSVRLRWTIKRWRDFLITYGRAINIPQGQPDCCETTTAGLRFSHHLANIPATHSVRLLIELWARGPFQTQMSYAPQSVKKKKRSISL